MTVQFSKYVNAPDEDTDVVSILFGNGALLMETELNEMQLLQLKMIGRVISMFGSGVSGRGVYNYDSSTGKLVISNETIFFDGKAYKLENVEVSDCVEGSTVKFYIEDRDIDSTETFRVNGNANGTEVDNYIVDSRLGYLSSKRKISRYTVTTETMYEGGKEQKHLELGTIEGSSFKLSCSTLDSTGVKNSIDELINDLQDISSVLNGHINNTNNPHQTDKSDVGLGNVENYSVASVSEAKLGNSTDKYMTPYTTKEAIYTLVPDASTSVAGKVKLNDTLTSSSTSEAATANTVKNLNDELTSLKNTSINGLTNLSTTINGVAGTSLTAESGYDAMCNAVSGLGSKLVSGGSLPTGSPLRIAQVAADLMDSKASYGNPVYLKGLLMTCMTYSKDCTLSSDVPFYINYQSGFNGTLTSSNWREVTSCGVPSDYSQVSVFNPNKASIKYEISSDTSKSAQWFSIIK